MPLGLLFMSRLKIQGNHDNLYDSSRGVQGRGLHPMPFCPQSGKSALSHKKKFKAGISKTEGKKIKTKNKRQLKGKKQEKKIIKKYDEQKNRQAVGSLRFLT